MTQVTLAKKSAIDKINGLTSVLSFTADTRTIVELQTLYGTTGTLRVSFNGLSYNLDLTQTATADVTTGGGVGLQAVADIDGFITFEQLGAVGDGVTGDRTAFTKASGRRVKATPGANYFIDMSDYLHATELSSGTYWDMSGADITYDHFGCPLFYANLNANGVTLIKPSFIFDGYAPATDVYSNVAMRDAYLIPASGAVGYSCALYFAGAENVRVENPRHKAKTPGPRRAQYAFIRLNNKYDALLDNNNYTTANFAERITISDVVCDDYNMGILGSGYKYLNFPGNHYFGRYQSYINDSTVSYGAPEHCIYISGYLDTTFLYCGFIHDDGIDQTTNSLGPRSANTVKLRRIKGFHFEGISSLRSHGLVDGEGYESGYFGPLSYTPRNPADLLGSVIRLSSDGNPIKNTIFTDTLIDAGATNEGLLTFLGLTGNTVTNLDLGRMTVRQTVTAGYAGIFASFEGIDKLRGKIDVNFSGVAPSNPTFLRLENCTNVDLDVFLSGLTTMNRVTRVGTNTDQKINVNSHKGQVYPRNKEQQDANPPSAQMRSYSGNLNRASSTTAGAFTYQLQSEGSYLVTFTSYQGGNNGIKATFMVHWGVSPAFRIAEKLGTNAIVGTNYTGLSGVVSVTGLLTFTATATAAVNMDAEIIVAPMGVAKANN